MRLISQDGTIDVPYEQVTLQIYDGYMIFAINDALTDDSWEGELASYSTEDMAKKAMDMLHQEWEKNGGKGYFKFPADREI